MWIFFISLCFKVIYIFITVLHNCFFFSLQGRGEGAGTHPSCFRAKAGFTPGRVASSSLGPIWALGGLGTMLKGTSAVFWRCSGTSPTTTRPSVLGMEPETPRFSAHCFWKLYCTVNHPLLCFFYATFEIWICRFLSHPMSQTTSNERILTD